MRRVLLFSVLVLCFTTSATAQATKPVLKVQATQPAASATAPAVLQEARAVFAKLPLSFEENVGQTDGRVKYLSRGSNYNLFLTADQAVFALRSGSVSPNCPGLARKFNLDCAHPSNQRPDESVLWLKMLGANPSARIAGTEPLPGKINYYVGNDPSKWRTGVRQYGRVSYREIYPGVDLTYYGNQQQLESDFIVAPGASPRSIQFEVTGARESRIDAQGNLILASDVGDVRLLRPIVYQVIKGMKHDVSGGYVLLAENRVGFEIGKYDAHSPLVIDPTFVYSTYLGGGALFSGGDQGLAIAIDSTGAAYVTGTGSSSDFPGSAVAGPVGQSTPFAFVTKFDPTGGSLVYSTLLRGTTGFNDSGNGIGVDSAGNAYVDGVTGDSDFPLLNPFQATIGDVFSASFFNFIQSGFVAGLAGDGTLIYSTYFGGRNSADQTSLNGLAADASGNAYVVGNTNSQNFPTVNPYQATQNSTFGGQNAIVAKFNPQGQPIYSTYLGGGGDEIGDAIAIDGSGNAYVTGQTTSNASFETGFPVQSSPAPFQATIKGSANAFVAKFTFVSPNLTLANSTYLGGSGRDEAFGIAVDNATPPNVYLTGETDSKTGTPFPTKNPIFGPSAGTFTEAFVTKLNGDFTALVYSTLLGGTGSASNSTGDAGYAIDLDGANPPNAFVTGSTPSTDFPVASPLQSTLGPLATSNAFVTEVNGAGSALTYSTYLGGSGSDKGLGIAVDSTGNAYITGTATSTNFPVSGSSGAAPYQGELRSSTGNAFVTKISAAAAPSALNFFPPSFNFHSVGVGQASPAESVTLSNNTASAVTISAGGITFTGANAGDFSQTNTCPVSPATLAAGVSCTISVVFNPTLQDGRTAQLSAASSAPTATMNLSGFGAVPEVSFSQSTLNFGTNDPLNVGALNFLNITNRGGAPLHVGNIEITGANASAFAVTFNSCTTPVPANGGSCFIEPIFTPTAAQAYSATLVINDDAAGSPQSIPMSGSGVSQVIVSPHSQEFGGWLVGTSSSDFTISLLNGTSGNITLTSITPSGNSGDFPIDPNNGTTCVANLVLRPGVSCNVEVFFKPTVGSAFDGRTATYTFNWTGAATGSQAVTLMGTGETGFTLYKNSITAPSEYVGASESQPNFDQLFNGNSFPVTVSSIVLSGANPQDFVVQLDTSCSTNGVVPANSVCYLDGRFSPSAVGTRTATATINYTPPGGSSLVLSLSGIGLAGPVVFPSSYDMGTQIVGITGPTQKVVLQNVQKTPLAISTVTPPGGTEFAVLSSSTCKSGFTVPGGGICFFDLTFTPGGTGSRTASIVVTDNGPGSPRTLNLTGTGEPAADTISVTPNAFDFGNVVLVVPSSGQPTVSANFYLINAGTTSTTISVAPGLTTGGTPFAIGAGTCVLNKVVLPQGGTCSVVVTFKPTTTGNQTNSVTLTDSVGGLHTVPIQGTGVNQGIMSFGTGPIFNQLPNTTTGTPLTATLTNSGSAPLTINSLYLTGANSSNFAIVPGQTTCAPGTTGVTLPAAPGPGNTCVVALTFTAPNTVGSYKANVSVTANLGNNVTSSTSTSLTGNVVAGGLSATPNPIDFGTIALGGSFTYSSLHSFDAITVTNNNPAAVTITSVAPQTAGDFTVSSNNCLATLPPPAQFSSQNTCTFDVTFAPTVNGPEPANKIVVTYNVAGGASGQQFLIPLTGSGSNALVAMPNPLSVSAAVGGFGSNPSITIGNGSASTVNVTAVGTITGAGAANFAVNFESCTGTSLFPSGSPFGTTCQVFFNYNPTAPGTNVAAQIPVSYNIGGGATQTLTVNLNSSATAAQVSIVPSQTPPTPLIFPGQALNTQSLVLSVLITNTGNDVLNITGLKITGANSNDFALAPQQQNGTGSQYASVIPCSNFGFGSIQPGESCTIPLTFTPAPPPLPGGTTRSATLTITDNAYPSKTQTVLLEGNATSGSVTVSPTNISFTDTSVGSSVTQSVLVTNGSSAAVTFTSVTFGTTSYTVDSAQTLNACSASKPLSAFTGSCVVYIKFSPKTGANPDTATIHTSGNSPTVTLSGNGVNPNVNAAPNSLTFTSQAVGTQSSPQAVTLSNPTGAAVTVSATPSISGTNPGDFILGTSSCTTGTIVPATTGSCVVNVIFEPAAAGGTARTATLSISDSPDATSPHTVTLSGTAIQPVASLSSATMSFGSINLGVTSGHQTVTLTNTGNATLNISSVVLGGTNAGDFVQATPATGTDCRTVGSLAASASCNVDATFTPTAAGSRSATITITDNATPATQVITLSGTGTQPAVSFLPTTIPFGNQRQGTSSAQMTTVLTNSGTGSLTITSVTLTGTNPGDFALTTPASGTDCRTAGTIAAAGGTCTIAATFTPTALGSRSATVSVADNATGSPHTVLLTGTGTFPQATPTPSPMAFGNQRQNVTSATQTLTLTNGGTDTLHLTTVALGGTNANQFAIVGTGTTCTNGSTVLAGASCVVKLTFTPTVLGAQTATVTFTDDASPTTQVVTLTGTGVFPQATPTPSPVAFGNQRQNVTSAAQTLTLTNGGTGTLSLTTVALGGTNANQFAIAAGTTCTNGSTVLAGGNCVVKLTFTPTALGAQTATVTFTDDASPTTQVVTLTGTGVFPQASPAPATVPFGNQANGITSAAQTVTLTNGGTGPLNLTTVALGGTNPGAFAIATGTTCTNGSTVPAGGSCVVKVTFTPTGLAGFTATLTFTDDASPTTQAVTLTGTGVTSTVNFGPSPVAFGNQRLNTASGQMTTVLTNSGATTLTITSVTLTGTNPGDFALTTPASGTDCRTAGTIAAAGGTCTIAATFTPTALGSRSATVSVADNATGSPHTVLLTGTGTFPQATPTPNPVAFNNQIFGTTSAPLTLTLTNGGTDVLHITTVALGGTNPADFAIATGTTCTNGSTVAAGSTCVVNLTFTPATANSFAATLTFTDDASPTFQSINLSGTGVTPPTATLSANSINFGNQRVNSASTAQNVTITNNGGAPLNVTTIAITGTNTSDFAFASPATTCPTSVSAQVAPASSCTLSITFNPTAANARSASITITVSGITSPTPITLSGTGIAPVATPSTATAAFGNQEVSTTSTAQNGTLNNTGTDVLHITAVAIVGANASDFSIVTAGTSCATGLPTAVIVAAAGNCTWSVKFTPTALGSRTASLTFTNDSGATPGTTQSVALTGNGTAPVVLLAPTTISFPAQAVNTPSAAMNGTLTNTGTTTLHLATVTITGTNAGDFAIASGGTTCTNGATVAATNGSCTWSVTFTPTAVGTRTATLTFTDDNNGVPGSTQTVALTGVTPPAATLSPSTPIAFGNQGVGTASSASPITVTNSGGSTLHITTVAISGTNAADFAVATTGTTCTNGSTVAPAASCVIKVTFTPAAAGARAATLTITDDASPTTQTVSLSGAGISFALSVPTPPAAATAGQPIAVTIQLTPGTGGFPNPVTFTASNLPPDTTASFSQTTLTPGTAVVTTTLTLTTTIRSGGNSHSIPPSRRPISGGWIATALLALLSMVTLRRGFRMQRFAYLPLAVLLLSAAIITGCTTAATGTPAGNYTVNVTATSGSYSQSTPVTITVQ